MRPIAVLEGRLVQDVAQQGIGCLSCGNVRPLSSGRACYMSPPGFGEQQGLQDKWISSRGIYTINELSKRALEPLPHSVSSILKTKNLNSIHLSPQPPCQHAKPQHISQDNPRTGKSTSAGFFSFAYHGPVFRNAAEETVVRCLRCSSSRSRSADLPPTTKANDYIQLLDDSSELWVAGPLSLPPG